MSKLIFLVTGDEAAQVLAGAPLRERLAAAGVRRLQLNLNDEPVAAAMHIEHLDEPIRGIVSVWDVAAREVAAALREALAGVGTVHGYDVDERRRLDPPQAWDATRVDALANVAVLRRPEELEHTEWLRRWMVEHTPVAIRTQATFGYVQNVVLAAVTPEAPRVDGIVEELFPGTAITDMHAFYGSGGDDHELNRRLGELMTSVARIGADRDLDLVPTSRYLHRLG